MDFLKSSLLVGFSLYYSRIWKYLYFSGFRESVALGRFENLSEGERERKISLLAYMCVCTCRRCCRRFSFDLNFFGQSGHAHRDARAAFSWALVCGRFCALQLLLAAPFFSSLKPPSETKWMAFYTRVMWSRATLPSSEWSRAGERERESRLGYFLTCHPYYCVSRSL